MYSANGSETDEGDDDNDADYSNLDLIDDSDIKSESIDMEPDIGMPAIPAQTEKKRYSCNKCDKSYNQPQSLREHQLSVHQNVRSHACTQCEKCFCLKKQLKSHMQRIHGLYNCVQCDAKFTKSLDLTRHIRKLHDGTYANVCEVCNKNFTTAAMLRKHSLAMHRDGVSRQSSEVKKSPKHLHICDICNKSFTTSFYLKTHRDIIHLGLRPFTCETCSETYRTAAELKVHQHVHTGVKAYPCDQCDREFNASFSLKNHKSMVHDEVPPQICDICNKGFATASELQRHYRTHTGKCKHFEVPVLLANISK